MVWRKHPAMLQMGLFCHRGTLSVEGEEGQDHVQVSRRAWVHSRQWCGELFHWEKPLYPFVFHHYLLLHHPTAKCALQKCLSMGFNIKRVILPCRDIWWGDPRRAAKGNVRFIKLWQLLSCHLHFPLWFSVQACLSCCQVTGDRKSISSRHSQDGFFLILASLQSPAIIRSF